MSTIQRINSTHTETLYKAIYRKLGDARRAAQKGQLAVFEDTNRQLATEAQAHIDALDNANTKETWDDALLRAGAWLAGLR